MSAPGVDTNFAIPDDISDPGAAKRFLTKAVDGTLFPVSLISFEIH